MTLRFIIPFPISLLPVRFIIWFMEMIPRLPKPVHGPGSIHRSRWVKSIVSRKETSGQNIVLTHSIGPANKIWQPSQRERCWSPRNLRGPASVAYRLSRPLRPRSPSTATQRLPWLLQPVQGGRSVLDVHGQLLRLTLLPHMCKGSALGDWHCGERHNDSGLIWFNLEKYIWIGFSSFKSKNWPALLNKFNIFSNATCEPCLETCD